MEQRLKTKLCFPQGKITWFQTSGNRRYPLNLGQYLSYAASFWLNVSIHAVVLSEVAACNGRRATVAMGGRSLRRVAVGWQCVQCPSLVLMLCSIKPRLHLLLDVKKKRRWCLWSAQHILGQKCVLLVVSCSAAIRIGPSPLLTTLTPLVDSLLTLPDLCLDSLMVIALRSWPDLGGPRLSLSAVGPQRWRYT